MSRLEDKMEYVDESLSELNNDKYDIEYQMT